MSDETAADAYVAGYYIHRRNGHVGLPVRVWFGPPIGEDGFPDDRSPRWQISISGIVFGDERNGGAAEDIARLEDVWPKALKDPIDRDEYNYRMASIAHHSVHDQTSPWADTRGRVNLDKAPPPF